MLKRHENELAVSPSQEDAIIFGEFKLNLGALKAFNNDELIPMIIFEFSVLKALISYLHDPLSRDKLMNLARS
ncbi:MAG: hypothetical protein ACFC03_00705 [Candidatus Malihini olakiniferum]